MRFSNVLKVPFKIEQITIDHIFDTKRPADDLIRRAKLVGPGLETIEDVGFLAAVDDVTDAAHGITYYDIVSKGPDNNIVRAKLSEINKNGKVYFTVSEISGGARVPATASSARRPARLTTSETISDTIPEIYKSRN